MKEFTVGEFKAHFSEILEDVSHGERIKVLFGKKKRPIAMLVPFAEEPEKKRKLGSLQGKMSFEIIGDGKMTEDELLGL